jgi:uncharacterized iron-regulated membrane protein
MKLQYNNRKWHAWISFAISLPILLVAVTAILIAHGQKLGFRDIKVDASWLPGYSSAPAQREVRATLATSDALWIGTLSGLFVQANGSVREVDFFAGQEVRSLPHTENTVFVLTTQGLFAQRGDEWKRVSKGPVASAYADGNNVYMTSRDKGLQVSDDQGGSWKPVADAKAALEQLPPLGPAPAKMVLARVIRDLHTGEALLGHDGEWIWNDVVGGTMTFLGVSGLFLWWRGQRRVAFRK